MIQNLLYVIFLSFILILLGGIWQENGRESFEELQEMFNEMFQTDMEAVCSASSQPSCSSSSSSCGENFISGNKRNSSEMNLSRNEVHNEYTAFQSTFKSFCFGVSPPTFPSLYLSINLSRTLQFSLHAIKVMVNSTCRGMLAK